MTLVSAVLPVRSAPPRPLVSLSWLAAGVWVGLALAVARAAVLWAMEAFSHGSDPELVRLRLVTVLPRVVLGSLAVGWVVAFGVWLAERTQRAGPRWVLRSLALLAATLLFALVLLGWWGADETRRVGLDTPRGLLAVRAIAAAGLVLAAGAVPWLVRRYRRARPRTVALVVPLVLAGAVPALGRAVYGRLPARHAGRARGSGPGARGVGGARRAPRARATPRHPVSVGGLRARRRGHARPLAAAAGARTPDDRDPGPRRSTSSPGRGSTTASANRSGTSSRGSPSASPCPATARSCSRATSRSSRTNGPGSWARPACSSTRAPRSSSRPRWSRRRASRWSHRRRSPRASAA